MTHSIERLEAGTVPELFKFAILDRDLSVLCEALSETSIFAGIARHQLILHDCFRETNYPRFMNVENDWRESC